VCLVEIYVNFTFNREFIDRCGRVDATRSLIFLAMSSVAQQRHKPNERMGKVVPQADRQTAILHERGTGSVLTKSPRRQLLRVIARSRSYLV
jgi:hypothetical protein